MPVAATNLGSIFQGLSHAGSKRFDPYFDKARVFTQDPDNRLWLAQLNPVPSDRRRSYLEHPLFIGYAAQGYAIVFYQARITRWTVTPGRVPENTNESRGLLADPEDPSHFIVVGGTFLFEIPRKEGEPARFRGEVRLPSRYSPAEIKLYLDEEPSPLTPIPLRPLFLSDSNFILRRSAFAALEK